MAKRLERFAHVLAMARDPRSRAELVPLDLASANSSTYDARACSFEDEDSVYVNTVAVLRTLSEGVRSAGVKPMGVVYNISSLRLVEPLVVERARAHGREPATPARVRERLGLDPCEVG